MGGLVGGGGLITGSFNEVLKYVLLGVILMKVFALIDAAIRPATAYTATDKQQKPFWLIILGVAVAWDMVGGALFSILTIAGVVAAIVYLVDVRPALRNVTKRSKDGSNMGPYGPW